MSRAFTSILLLTCACSANTTAPVKEPEVTRGEGCGAPDQCAVDETCLHGSCIALPTTPNNTVIAQLIATPGQLSFGTVAVGDSQRLSIVLENIGEGIVTIDGVGIEPVREPFVVEPFGNGPFWIRPGRARPLFITYAPLSFGFHTAQLVIDSAAPTLRITLTGS